MEFQKIITDLNFLENNLHKNDDKYIDLYKLISYKDLYYNHDILFDVKNYNKDFYKLIYHRDYDKDKIIIYTIIYCKIYSNYFNIENINIYNKSDENSYLYEYYTKNKKIYFNSFIELFFNDFEKFIDLIKTNIYKQPNYLRYISSYLFYLYPYINYGYNEYNIRYFDFYKLNTKIYYNANLIKLLKIEKY